MVSESLALEKVVKWVYNERKVMLIVEYHYYYYDYQYYDYDYLNSYQTWILIKEEERKKKGKKRAKDI